MGEVEKAHGLYRDGKYCSQAILGAFCEKYGMDTDTAFRISCGLNSGMRCAEVCGVVSGAVLVIGLQCGDSNDECNARTEEFIRLFKKRKGSIICRDIMGCDIFTPDGKEDALNRNLFDTVCADAVVCSAEILIRMGM
jgi:C_GCAxxG_C_C family probable redox protein